MLRVDCETRVREHRFQQLSIHFHDALICFVQRETLFAFNHVRMRPKYVLFRISRLVKRLAHERVKQVQESALAGTLDSSKHERRDRLLFGSLEETREPIQSVLERIF